MTTREKSERVLLPRVWDVIRDGLVYHNRNGPNDDVDLLICDFSDAFYMIPLGADEQCFYVAAYHGKFYVWTRVVQGSVNGPNLFGRLSALVGSFSQACFSVGDEARIQIYADDPCAVIRGTEQRRKRIMATLLMLWLLLGFTLAVHKGQRGKKVVRVGYQLQITPESIVATLKPSFMNDFAALTKDILSHNVPSLKTLRRYAGQANHISGFLFAWRPFLESLWAALAAHQPAENRRIRDMKGRR